MAEQTTGLLKKAQSLLAESTPSFDVWAVRSGFKHAGIFQLHTPKSAATEIGGGYYCMAEAVGFSVKTIASSLSTKQFWDATLSKAFEWQCFSKEFNELLPFLDLFGDDIRQSIDSLYFLPFKDKTTPLFLVIAEFEDDDDITLPDSAECARKLSAIVEFENNEEKRLLEMENRISKGISKSSANLLILSLKSCVEKTIQNMEIWRKMSKIDMVDRIEMKAHILRAVSFCALTLLDPMFPTPNCIHIGANGELKLILFANDEPDEEAVSFHIAHSLSSLLGEDASKKILLLSAGICQNKKGAGAFLKKG